MEFERIDGRDVPGERGYVPAELQCVECGTPSGPEAHRWRGYRIDDPTDDEEPALAFYCPICAEREFGPLGRGSESGYYSY